MDLLKASGAAGAVMIPNPKVQLFDQVREVLRFHRYALRILLGGCGYRFENLKSR